MQYFEKEKKKTYIDRNNATLSVDRAVSSFVS